MFAVCCWSDGGHQLIVLQDPSNKDVLHVYLFHELFESPVACFVVPIDRLIGKEVSNATPKKASK